MKEKETGIPMNAGESVIDLSDMFWFVIAKWRRIICWMLLFAVLLFGASEALGLIKLNDSEEVQLAQENYDHAMRAYETRKAQLESRMREVTLQISEQDDYKANSVLYAIDPYNVCTKQVTYYIDTGFEIIPENTYQNPNYSVPVVNAYMTMIMRIPVEALLKGIDPDQEYVEYDKKGDFLTVTGNESNGILNVTAIGANKEQTDIIMDAVDKTIRDYHDTISKAICEHTVTCLGINDYYRTKDELVQLHDDVHMKSVDLTSNMNYCLEQYDALKEPDDISLSSFNTLKQAIKTGILGAIAGVFLSLVYYCILFILKGTAAGSEDISRRYNTSVLGVYTQPGKANRFDRLIARFRGLNADNPAENTDALIAANIRHAARDGAHILMAGTTGRERIGEICGRLGALVGSRELRPCGNVAEDADSVDALNDCDCVIFVEEIGETTHREIAREVEKAARTGKPVLGFILSGKARL